MARSPLFDLYDPYDLLTQQAQLGLLPEDDEEMDVTGVIPLRRKPRLSDLMPEEQQTSLLSSLAQTGSTGLQWAGYLLDTPGALVRGVLAGKPLSVFGTSEDRVTGRELLRQYGMTGSDDTWGNFGTGLLAEIALDPLTYLNPFAALGRGALTKSVGVPLQKAGLLRNASLDAARGFGGEIARTADDVARLAGDTVPGLPGPAVANRQSTGVREYLRNLTPEQAFGEARTRLTPAEYDEAVRRFEAAGGRMDDASGAAGLMSFRIPGTRFQYDITGGAFGDSIAKGLDTAGDFIQNAPYVGPVARTMAAGFDSRAGYTIDPRAQDAHRQAYAAATRNEERFIEQMARVQRGAMEANVPESIDLAGATVPVPAELRSFASPQLQNALRDYLESPRPAPGALSIPGSAPMRSSGDPIADWLLSNVPEFRAAREALESLPDSAIDAARSRALPLPSWASRLADTEFFPRQLLWMDRDQLLPEQMAKGRKPYSRGERLFEVVDNFGRSRQQYTDIPGGARTFRALTGGPRAKELQDALLRATNEEAPQIIDDFFRSEGLELPYQRMIDNADDVASATDAVNRMKVQLADLLRATDRQFADQGIGIFDTPVFADAVRYGRGQARNAAFADTLISEIVSAADSTPAELVSGGTSIPLRKAAEDLKFDADSFARLFNQRTGQDITNFSIDKRTVEALKALAPETRLGLPESQALGLVDSFNRWFKAGALAWPAFHSRNAASNIAAGLAAEAPIAGYAGYSAAKGNRDVVARMLRNAPIYSDLPDDAARAAKFADDAAKAGITSGTLLEDSFGISEQAFPALYPGASRDNRVLDAVGDLFSGTVNDRPRTWSDWFTLRGSGVNRPAPATRNPILRINDAIGETVEDTSRLGMFAELLRQGYEPTQAGDMVRRALVDYRSSAFTPMESQLLKRLVPFYSFQKGVLGGIGDNLLQRPGGFMGQSIRAVTAASRPNPDNILPEKFRRSSAIPLPYETAEGLRRYLVPGETPWESVFNLFTPGVGATTPAFIGDTLMQTGSNLLGQTTPLLKGPLEFITDRQLYSGRNLSDLYSVLENAGIPGGRGLEQAISNFVPFGTRGLSIYRQLNDQRLSPADRYLKALFNTFAPAKLSDEDIDKQKRLAARNMLNKILETTPGVRTYENITVPPEALEQMAPQQRDLYLLYRILQSEAAKRARDKKKQETALDPLELLGAVQRF